MPSREIAAYPIPELAVTPEAFARQVGFCAEHYECLPVREAVERLGLRRAANKPLLAITFDDGYQDNFKYAKPALEAHGVRATFFVITALAASGGPPWHDRLARALTHLTRAGSTAEHAVREWGGWRSPEISVGHQYKGEWSVLGALREAGMLSSEARAELVERVCNAARANGWEMDGRDRTMSCDELLRLRAQGHEVASHTRSHPILTRLPPGELLAELEGSRQELFAILGEEVTSLAYPNGNYDDQVIGAAGRAGYRYAVTTKVGLNTPAAHPLRLRRVFMSQDRLSRADGEPSSALLEMELTGAAETLLLRRYRRRVPR